MSDHYEVVYSPDAQRDLENIYNYIKFSLLDSFAATRQFNHLRAIARSLSTFPALGMRTLNGHVGRLMIYVRSL